MVNRFSLKETISIELSVLQGVDYSYAVGHGALRIKRHTLLIIVEFLEVVIPSGR